MNIGVINSFFCRYALGKPLALVPLTHQHCLCCIHPNLHSPHTWYNWDIIPSVCYEVMTFCMTLACSKIHNLRTCKATVLNFRLHFLNGASTVNLSSIDALELQAVAANPGRPINGW